MLLNEEVGYKKGRAREVREAKNGGGQKWFRRSGDASAYWVSLWA